MGLGLRGLHDGDVLLHAASRALQFEGLCIGVYLRGHIEFRVLR